MAEDDDRQTGSFRGDEVVDDVDIGDDLGNAIPVRELARRGIGRPGCAVAAMVVGVDVKTALAEEIGEAARSARRARPAHG